ncbi:hypothetical protein HMPREF1579_01434 [Gardnerella vaginalis JCP8066]|nr:hypothetical protein HMPREF1579_01434 [Gardnerella vaginalis JCP8066]
MCFVFCVLCLLCVCVPIEPCLYLLSTCLYPFGTCLCLCLCLCVCFVFDYLEYLLEYLGLVNLIMFLFLLRALH